MRMEHQLRTPDQDVFYPLNFFPLPLLLLQDPEHHRSCGKHSGGLPELLHLGGSGHRHLSGGRRSGTVQQSNLQRVVRPRRHEARGWPSDELQKSSACGSTESLLVGFSLYRGKRSHVFYELSYLYMSHHGGGRSDMLRLCIGAIFALKHSGINWEDRSATMSDLQPSTTLNGVLGNGGIDTKG